MGRTPGIILVGGGGHAKVVLDAMRRAGLEPMGYVDDMGAEAALGGRLTCLGALDELLSLGGAAVMLGVGDLRLRKCILEQYVRGRVAPALAHPRAVISHQTELSDGVFVGPGAIVNPDARIAPHAVINTGAIVEHDCEVGQNTHIAPGARLGGSVRVGEQTLIGIGSTVLPGVCIGERCVVGAGAVVVDDVPDGSRVVGVPARAVTVVS